MAQPLSQSHNPGLLDENEQIPAKIWELLRRNQAFRSDVQRLAELDAKERNNWEKTGTYHGAAWQKSYRLVKRIGASHPFAGVALQWLVPEPLFHCHVATWPRGKKWRKQPVFITRFLRVGEGTENRTSKPKAGFGETRSSRTPAAIASCAGRKCIGQHAGSSGCVTG